MSPGSPPALRVTRHRWRDPRLLVGLVTVTLCALLGARALESADDTVAVWAVRGALGRGQEVGEADLMRREVRFVEQADADRYLSAGGALPTGTTVDRPVGAGELLPRSALQQSAVGPLTEVPLSVGSEAVPATVRVGSTVDVWVTPKPAAADPAASAPSRSSLVFDDVPVVSAPRTGTSLGPSATRQVTVGIRGDQSAQLPRSIAALADGDVTLTAQR